MIRMIIIGVFEIPIFLWSGTAIAPCVTSLAKTIGAFPKGVAAGTLISHSTCEGPIEKFMSILIGKFGGNPSLQSGAIVVLALAAYLLLFFWYAKQMHKRNAEYIRVAKLADK
jgi:PTS system galactitol-specific IIC component